MQIRMSKNIEEVASRTKYHRKQILKIFYKRLQNSQCDNFHSSELLTVFGT